MKEELLRIENGLLPVKNKNTPMPSLSSEYESSLFPRAALRNVPMDVTSTVNSAQAPSRHTRGSA